MCGSHDGPQWITYMNLQSLSTWPTWSEDSTPFSDHSVLKIILLLTPLRPAEKKKHGRPSPQKHDVLEEITKGSSSLPLAAENPLNGGENSSAERFGWHSARLLFLLLPVTGFSSLHLDVQVFPGIVLHHSDSHGLPSKKLWSGSLVPINGERIYRFAVYRNIRYIYTSK